MNDVESAPARASSSTAFLNRLLEVDRVSELAEMISGIAHELNQPLAAMTTFSQAGARMLDRSEPLVERGLEVFREISQEALQAGARLQKLRRLFDAGPPRQTRCTMADLLAEVQPVLSGLVLGFRTRLQIDIGISLPDVMVERLKIQRVLLALVRNAAEASSSLRADGVIRINVLRERYSVETTITDAGAGVPVDLQPQLFHPFFTTKPSGRGLGLSSCRAIVESHGGTIGFRNVPSGGGCSWFKLPVATR